MVSGRGLKIAKGGLALCCLGAVMTLLGIFISFWGPKGTGIISFNSSLITIAQAPKFWYIYFIPLFGITCAALAGASYLMENRGVGASTGVLGFAILFINVLFMFHMTLVSSGAMDFMRYITTGIPLLRLGWYFTAFGGFIIIIGGSLLSNGLKKSKMTPEAPPYQPEPAPQFEPVAAPPQPAYQPETVYFPTADAAAPEEEPPRPEPPPPPEDLLPLPRDDIPPPLVEAKEEEPEPETSPELDIEKGYNYLVLDEMPRNAFNAIGKLTTDGTKCLCLSTMFPSKIDKEYNLENVEKIWISHSSTPEHAAIDPKRLDFEITRTISNFMKESGGVILVDGLEYLVVENGFDNVLKFLKKIGDFSSMNKSTLIVPLNPASLSSDQLTLLKREFDRVHDFSKKNEAENGNGAKKPQKQDDAKKNSKQ